MGALVRRVLGEGELVSLATRSRTGGQGSGETGGRAGRAARWEGGWQGTQSGPGSTEPWLQTQKGRRILPTVDQEEEKCLKNHKKEKVYATNLYQR